MLASEGALPGQYPASPGTSMTGLPHPGSCRGKIYE